MLFAVSVGSEGSAQEKFSIHVPFNFAVNRRLDQEEQLLTFCKHVRVGRIEKFTYHNAIIIEGFSTEEKAQEFIPKIFSSLMWASLKYRIGICYPKSIVGIQYFDKTYSILENGAYGFVLQEKEWTELDGTYETQNIAIIPEHKKLVRFEIGRASITAGLHSGHFVDELAEVWQHKTPERILENKKLRTAIELYSRVDFESSIYAQFLMFVIILETITPSIDSSEICVQAIDLIIENISKTKDEYKSDTPEFLDLQGLAERIRYNKKQSFRYSISNFFAALAKENKKLGDEAEVRNILKNIYDGRSRFVHNGKADEEKLIIWNNFLR